MASKKAAGARAAPMLENGKVRLRRRTVKAPGPRSRATPYSAIPQLGGHETDYSPVSHPTEPAIPIACRRFPLGRSNSPHHRYQEFRAPVRLRGGHGRGGARSVFGLVVRIPVDAGHQFRTMPGQDSGPCRATIPEHAGQGK
jgi:hypothetical protein